MKRGDQSARVAHPDLRKESLETKVVDEKDSISIELDENQIREGKTSRGNTKITKNVTPRIRTGKTARNTQNPRVMHMICKDTRKAR